jgi:2-polyprenyl-3-methyl-5-hydroxy-6-metoxy-1,4-benzoquinol methylase
MQRILDSHDAQVRITDAEGGSRLEVVPRGDGFIPYREWVTRYPDDLVQKILDTKGLWVLDEIKRDEDPDYVEHEIRWEVLGYVDPKAFDGARILDFGSGSGASSMVMARLAPKAEIVGVELEAGFVDIARERARFHGVEDRVRFVHSEDPARLPDGIGRFDFIVLSAVFEHLLPQERRDLIPLLWGCLKDGGIVFINQTPHRWFPIEHHTTRLPLINYLPDRLTGACARAFSARVPPGTDWPTLLRKGIRGATHASVMGTINAPDRRGVSLKPTMYGMRDHFDLWYGYSNRLNPNRLRRLARAAFKALYLMTGTILVPYISMAVRKEAPRDPRTANA